MRDAYGGAGRIDALSAGAAGAEGIETEIGFLDVQLDIVAHIGNDVHRCERGMPTAGGVEGGNADQAMDTALALEKAESVRAGDAQGDALETCFVAGQIVQFLHGEAASRRPAGIETQQHFRPVLRFGAARARMDFQDGVLSVLLGGKQHDQFGFIQQFFQAVLLLGKGFQRFVLGIFSGQLEPFEHVVVGLPELLQAGHLVFEAALFAQQGRQTLGIVPCAGTRQGRFDFGKAAFVGRDVKDAPRVGKNDRTGARNGRAVHSVAA